MKNVKERRGKAVSVCVFEGMGRGVRTFVLEVLRVTVWESEIHGVA